MELSDDKPLHQAMYNEHTSFTNSRCPPATWNLMPLPQLYPVSLSMPLKGGNDPEYRYTWNDVSKKLNERS